MKQYDLTRDLFKQDGPFIVLTPRASDALCQQFSKDIPPQFFRLRYRMDQKILVLVCASHQDNRAINCDAVDILLKLQTAKRIRQTYIALCDGSRSEVIDQDTVMNFLLKTKDIRPLGESNQFWLVTCPGFEIIGSQRNFDELPF